MDENTLLIMRFLVRTGRMTEVAADDLLDPVDLTTTELLALHQIQRANGQLSPGTLAQCMAFVKSNATQVIDRMEDAQHVRRVPSLDDRRCKLIEMTEQGQQAHDSGMDALQPLAERIQVLTSEEQAQLLSLLRRLGESLA